MKRLIVAGSALVVITSLIAPALIGRVVEREFRAALDGASLPWAAGLANSHDLVTIGSYHRGWLRSHGTLSVALPSHVRAAISADVDATDVDTDLEAFLESFDALFSDDVVIAFEVRHGPVLWGPTVALGLYSASAHIDESSPVAATLHEQVGIQRFVDIRAHQDFSGSLLFDVEFPAIAYEKDGLAIAFSGARVDGSYHAGFQLLDTSATIGSLDATVQGSRLAIGAAQARSQYAGTVADVWLGDSHVTMGHISIVGREPDDFVELSDLQVHSRTGAATRESQVDFENRISLTKLRFGAADEITDGSMLLAMRGIPQGVLHSYRDFANTASFPSTMTSDDKATRLRELMFELLQAAPQLELGPVEFQTGNGQFRGRASATLDRERLPDGLRLSMATALPVLLMAGRVDGELSAPADLVAWLVAPFLRMQLRAAADATGQEMSASEIDAIVHERLRTMIENLLSTGLLRRLDGDLLRSEIEFAQGKLTVNGAAVPLLR